MALCPVCQSPGAYIGFSSIECRNQHCEHFVLFEEILCPCCGKPGHVPSEECSAQPGQVAQNVQANVITPSTNNGLGLDVDDPSWNPDGTPSHVNTGERDGAVFGTIGPVTP